MIIIDQVDNFLNRITMYRLVLYYLLGLYAVALVLSLFGILPFSILALLGSGVFITLICWATNYTFANVFKVPANVESLYITALILTLIITPTVSVNNYLFMLWAAVLAMATKYILAWRKKHIFNPAAAAVAITALAVNQSASWWIGTTWLAPFVLAGGLLVVRKVLRFDLVLGFLMASLATILAFTLRDGINPQITLTRVFLLSPLFFFAAVMLTEPLTTPPTRWLRIMYGIIVGILFAPQFHVGSFYFSPETALLAGNIFVYLVSPKARLVLTLKEAVRTGSDIADFVFVPDRPFKFKAGQYLEWTLGHEHPDSRGNRRYFTIASSPTEPDIRLGVKFYDKPSSFKTALDYLQPGDKIIASQLAGEFTLPEKSDKKLVFIAGGIGITPFRSMIKYLLDTKQKLPIVLLYSNRNDKDIAYQDIFDKAAKDLGMKIVYTLTDPAAVPANWVGRTGYIDDKMVAQEVPDYKDCLFYASGSHSLVMATKAALAKLGIPHSQIVADFFPGFA